jgi:2-dehydro-3-deoxygalactonokinase
MADAAVAAVDWGTTRMRVWLLDAGGAVLAERRSDEGLLSVADAGGFEAVLERHLDELGAAKDLPVITCGMVGARQGWIEAPYVTLPAKIDAVLSGAIKVPGIWRDVRIVPGAALKLQMRPDVMRGEETQLAGAAAKFADGSALVCLPGTHSKWALVRDGVLTDFSTWMTGELFSVIAAHSILSRSVAKDTSVDPESEAFATWVGRALASPQDITTKLFKIRAGGLLFGMGEEDSTAALSGLLMGAEIASAKRQYGVGDVLLVASGPLALLYGMALSIAGYTVTRIDADQAVRAGLFAAAQRNFLEPAKASA